MKSFSLALMCLVMTVSGTETTCKQLKDNYMDAPSGVYKLTPCWNCVSMEVYCEMGLNGGGYTFLNSKELEQLTDADLESMFTDTTTFLLRLKKCNGDQPYIVLKQLTRYAGIPLKLGLNEHNHYAQPVNAPVLGNPYLYFGFLPIAHAANRNVQGVWANGKEFTFRNSDSNPNSFFALFANYKEQIPSSYAMGTEWPFINQVLDSAKINPSKREMPVDYFYFMEAHFGGGGCYTQTDSRLDKKCISSVAIGFR